MLNKICVDYGGHTSICQQVEVIAEGSKLYIVLEYVSGGNLLSKIVQEGPMEESQVKTLIRSMLEGLKFLHDHNIVHADLQPENILLMTNSTSGTGNSRNIEEGSGGCMVKIADFGSAVDLNLHDPFGSRYGSTKYTSPECLRAEEAYSTSADMWSVGAIAYFMLSGSSAFDDPSKRKTLSKVLRAEYAFPPHLFANVSRQAKQFISSLIHVDPTVRLTVQEALEHPFLAGSVTAQQHRLTVSSSTFRSSSVGAAAVVEKTPGHRRKLSLGSLGMGNTSERSQNNDPKVSTARKSYHDSSVSSSSTGVKDSSGYDYSRRSPGASSTKKKSHHRRKTSFGTLTKGIKSLLFSKSNQETSVPGEASAQTLTTHHTTDASDISFSSSFESHPSPQITPRKKKFSHHRRALTG